MRADDRPRLRPLDVQEIRQPDAEGLLLIDHEGLLDGQVFVPEGLLPVIAVFDGARSVAEIAAELGRRFGQDVPVDFVAGVADQLDERLCLEGPRVEAARRRRREAFDRLEARPAVHAGSAGYPAEPGDCAAALDDLLGRRTGHTSPAAAGGTRLAGLVAPHIDLARGAGGYRAIYGALDDHTLPELFVVFGTSHHGGSHVLIPCGKHFDTPVGRVPVDRGLVDRLVATAGRPEVWDEELLHLGEHSVELQALMLRRVLGDRPLRILPFLCGRLPAEPDTDPEVAAWVDALAEVCAEVPGGVAFVAGADLAHLGPFFGDAEPVDDALLGDLAHLDRGSLDLYVQGRTGDFHAHVEEDDNPRRICGTAPMYWAATLARRLYPDCRLELLDYSQAVAEDRSQVVSHASVVIRA
ncbi:MAG: AmmeMemoRadiSam system protein B [Planctomycetota bacterium]